MCEVNNRQSSGCIISVSENAAGNNIHAHGANLISPVEKRRKLSLSGSLSGFFSSSKPAKVDTAEEDRKVSEFIAQLRNEGRSDGEIALHLSYLRDIKPVAPILARRGSKNPITQMVQLIKDEFSLTQLYPEYETDLQRLSVSVAANPFYGALADELTYEELSALEPVYVGAKSSDKLPCRKYDGTPLPGDQTDCPVCITSFKKGEKLKSLPCVHFFHKDCIDSWLMVGHNCPVCKTQIE